MSEDTTVESVQSRLDAEIANARKLRARAQAAEAERDEMKEHLSEAQGALAAEQAARTHRQQQARSEHDETLAAEQAAGARALAERDERIAELTGSLEREFGTNRLAAALGAAGVKPELIGQACKLLGDRVRVSLRDGRAVVEVLGANGEPMQTESNEPATLDEMVAAWAPANGHFFPPSGDAGSGQHKGSGSGSVSLSELDANPARKVEFIERHGQEKYLRLAARELASQQE